MTDQTQISFTTVDQNADFIEAALFYSNDLKKRRISFNETEGILFYLESMADTELVEQNVIAPFYNSKKKELSKLFTTLSFDVETELNKGIQGLINGGCLYFVEGISEFYILSTPAKHERTIAEPLNEAVIRGPHNGFIEDMTVNLYLIRKQITTPNLTVRYFTLGKIAPKKVALIYMENLAKPELVKKVESRIQKIILDSVLSTGFIQELTEDNSYSIFPQHINTERPDHTSFYLLKGYVTILLDGDPTALIVPASFFTFYQTPDDYSNRWLIASFVRFIRLIGFVTAFQLPALYIATVSFHSSVLPLQLFFTIQGSLTRIPFPPLVEAMLLELIFELLREAGLRLPSRVGQTIGIVGGLVIGDAIVKAGLVSYSMIIVVALTAISSFLIPSNEMSSAIRFMRFPLMVAASLFGYIGISFGLTLIFIHLCKLESFGQPYLTPLSPVNIQSLKDTFLRLPIWSIRKNTSKSEAEEE
ncbi:MULTISPECIES: spore germination protein [unclassified Paenibacillus]|uniref:spore germination protein n=1 Tax=unclassified Paenibacillus TaxID=185978 RepID=UPI0004F90360|nr:spore germination protein [Paenibacillus sp. FSL R5-0345]AIQ37809.1 spore gernimation protein GerK [Paenibacillus sp. FSL R5-0345]